MMMASPAGPTGLDFAYQGFGHEAQNSMRDAWASARVIQPDANVISMDAAI
jgi:hypothetical protein